MTDISGLLPLVNRLYAATIAPEEWPAVFADVARLFEGTQAHLRLLGRDGAALFSAAAGIDARGVELLESEETVRLATPFLSRMPRNAAVSSADLFDPRIFERSAFYNEVIRPLDGYHSLSAALDTPLGSTYVSICRPRRDGAYSDAKAAALQALLPHLATALELDQRLRAAENRAGSLLGLLDALDSGVVLTDARARPLFANASAQCLAQARDGLLLQEEGLRASTPSATRRMRAAIAAVAGRAAGASRVRLTRPSGRPPLLLTLLPIGMVDAALPGQRSPRVALFIADPQAPAAIEREAVAETFGLTPREADMSMLLAAGHGVAAAADMLGLRVTTARQYVKQAFAKTGVHSQAMLVALIRGYVGYCR